jgi:hypothetical protein
MDVRVWEGGNSLGKSIVTIARPHTPWKPLFCEKYPIPHFPPILILLGRVRVHPLEVCDHMLDMGNTDYRLGERGVSV